MILIYDSIYKFLPIYNQAVTSFQLLQLKLVSISGLPSQVLNYKHGNIRNFIVALRRV